MKSFFAFLTLVFVLAASFAHVPIVHAQDECRDATGAVIPCPPSGGDSGSDDTDDSGGNGGGGQNPPPSVLTPTYTPSPTPSPEPTSTPLPIQNKPTEDPTKNAPVYEVTPTPTAEPVITSSGNNGSTEGENDWEDVCTFDLCLGLTVACYWDGGKPEVVEDGSGNTGIHCSIPDDDSGAPSPWKSIGLVAVGIVLLMGILLPAVQKFKNKPDAPQERSWDTFGDIKGDNVTPTSKPRTREHILLAKQQDGNTSGASKPKPKPKPAPKPTPPPAQPKPPSSGTPGDFDSDGTVDGHDFLP